MQSDGWSLGWPDRRSEQETHEPSPHGVPLASSQPLYPATDAITARATQSGQVPFETGDRWRRRSRFP